uniref:BTG anti-proliferation factor 2 n=1 Tax=Leptobrachium leishanense TaxID=445787 RepID=A0A8C5LNL5_9ANUR
MAQGNGTIDAMPEIDAAVSFLSSLLHGRMCERQVQLFGAALRCTLTEYYSHHWFPDKPAKGSGYRCIRINHMMDPVISNVASRINMKNQHLLSLLPKELTLWVDPYEVSYRIGEDGSICVLYEAAVPTVKGQLLSSSKAPRQYLITVSS